MIPSQLAITLNILQNIIEHIKKRACDMLCDSERPGFFFFKFKDFPGFAGLVRTLFFCHYQVLNIKIHLSKLPT